jgi:hypothetical protein
MAAKQSVMGKRSKENKEVIPVSQSSDVCSLPIDRIQIATRNDSDFFQPSVAR